MGRLMIILGIVIAVLGAAFYSTMLFTVDQREQVLILRFGEPVGVVNPWGSKEDPGLHMKTFPWENVVKFDRRNLMLDIPPQEITASDQERLIVDAFARFRISDPLQFYKAVTDVRGATARLAPFMEASLRRVLGGVKSNDIVSGHRAELMIAIRDAVNAQAAESRLGVEIIDVKIRRADLPEQNAEKVYSRMQSERQQAASLIRARGEERARTLRAEAARTVRITLAKAREKSSILRGAGDARRNDIYAAAYSKDPEFFAFYRSMEAYEKTLIDGKTSMVLSPDSDFFGYFDTQKK
jgi:modulator of FtsH protease HflC